MRQQGERSISACRTGVALAVQRRSTDSTQTVSCQTGTAYVSTLRCATSESKGEGDGEGLDDS